MNALTILRREHTRIAQIFEEIDALPESACLGRAALVQELDGLVRRHVAMEDALMSAERLEQMGHDALALQYLDDLQRMECHDPLYVPRIMVVRELLLRHVEREYAEAV